MKKEKEITFRFTTSTSHNTRSGNKPLCIEFSNEGKRKYVAVATLVEDLKEIGLKLNWCDKSSEDWNKKKQLFVSADSDVANNNATIKAIKAYISKRNEELTDKSYDLVHIKPCDYYPLLISSETPDNKPKAKTFGDFIELLYEQNGGKSNWSTTKKYKKLLSVIREIDFDKQILSELTRQDVADFHKYLIKDKRTWGGKPIQKGYYDYLIQAFNHTLSVAADRGLCQYIRYTASNDGYNLTKELETSDVIQHFLKYEDYERLFKIDINELSGRMPTFKKQAYKDFYVLMWELRARPIDLALLRFSDIHEDNINGKCFQYTKYKPKKKRNSHPNDIAIREITPRAAEIINKYRQRAKSDDSYIIPLNFHARILPTDTDDDLARKFNSTDTALNSHLRTLCDFLGIDKHLTLYSIRRGAITHACKAPDANLDHIAASAGTGANTIRKRYNNTEESELDFIKQSVAKRNEL